MNTINSVTAKVTNCHQPHLTSLHHHRPIFSISKPVSSFSFKPHFSYRAPSPTLSYTSIQASSSKTPFNPLPHIPIHHLKPIAVAAVTAAVLFVTQFNLFVNPAFAAPVAPPPVVGSKADSFTEEEREREIEEQLVSNPNDVDALRSLMEIRIKNKKVPEAMRVIDKLIELEPKEVEWHLLKSHLYVHDGQLEMAKIGFNEIISRDPLRVEAYHGLVMAASQDDSGEELEEIEKKIEEGMKLAKEEGKTNDLRDFLLLIAQIKVIEGEYDSALKVYSSLVKEEPRDFRPYLCQGIIYTLLRNNAEAEKCFEKYRRLVPKGHPYTSYFDDNMIATKVFAQKVENERVGMKS